MTYSFVNRPSVKHDILEAVDYYKKISPELAQLFIQRLAEAKVAIAISPEGFQIRYKNVRIKMLEQFPYHIHYLINSDKQQINIIAITHAYKRPKEYLTPE